MITRGTILMAAVRLAQTRSIALAMATDLVEQLRSAARDASWAAGAPYGAGDAAQGGALIPSADDEGEDAD